MEAIKPSPRAQRDNPILPRASLRAQARSRGAPAHDPPQAPAQRPNHPAAAGPGRSKHWNVDTLIPIARQRESSAGPNVPCERRTDPAEPPPTTHPKRQPNRQTTKRQRDRAGASLGTSTPTLSANVWDCSGAAVDGNKQDDRTFSPKGPGEGATGLESQPHPDRRPVKADRSEGHLCRKSLGDGTRRPARRASPTWGGVHPSECSEYPHPIGVPSTPPTS